MRISPEQRERLLAYRYSGGDSSLIYAHVLSPFAQLCVDTCVPRFIAPNVITLLGLIASLFALVLTLCLNPTLSSTEHRWLHLVTAICILLYQTLDNMDGKQARRTNSSSPLGMLFDHGCDAINATVMSIPIAGALCTGWTPKVFFGLWCAYVPFHVQTWEEYHLGAMILPPINGPSEGLLIATGLCITSYVLGAEWWQNPQQLLYNISPFTLLFGIAIIGALITIYFQITSVIRVISTDKSTALCQLIPFFIFLFTSIAYCNISTVALVSKPTYTMLLIGCIFVEINVHIMFQHLIQANLSLFSIHTAYILPLLLVRALVHISVPLLNEGFMLRIASIYVFAHTTRVLYELVTEMAEALNIHVFSLQEKTSKRKVA